MRRFVIRAAASLSVVLGVSTAAAQTDAEVSRRLSELEQDTKHRSLLSDPLGKAKRALERARRSSPSASWAPEDKATDRQAALLRSVAGAWLDVARDLVRASEAEKTANDAQKRLDDAETKVARSKALLEETIARRSRTQAQLDALERPKAEPSPTPAPSPPPPAKPKAEPKK